MSKEIYEAFRKGKPAWFEKQKFMREVFAGVDLDYVLESLSLSIQTVDECLVYIGEGKCRKIRENNEKNLGRLLLE